MDHINRQPYWDISLPTTEHGIIPDQLGAKFQYKKTVFPGVGIPLWR